MLKKEVVLVLSFLFCISFVSAVSVSLTNPNPGLSRVDISGASNLYAYEIDLDADGSIISVSFDGFLSSDGATTSTGYNKRNSILSVYASRLDADDKSISGSGDLFDIFYSSGSISLRYALFIYNDSTSEYIYYNETAATTSNGGGGGGGGGTSISATTPREVSLDISNLNIDLVIDSSKKRIIKVTNDGEATDTFSIIQQNLDGVVFFDEKSVTLLSGESKEITFTFIGPSSGGVSTGKILIGGQPIYISLNARSKELLFDAMIVVAEDNKMLKFGDRLGTQITLIPMGIDPRVDVTLNYLIKDFEGKTYVSESETILVENQRTFKKDFHTGNLPVGNYVVGLEVVYPNGVAASSSHFQIVKKTPFSIEKILIGVIAGIIVLIVLVLIFIIRYVRHRKKILRRKK